MNTITIYNNGDISINGRATGLRVTQEQYGTAVYRLQENERRSIELVPVPMPARRYALSCDKPASGNPGRADFEKDLLAVMEKHWMLH